MIHACCNMAGNLWVAIPQTCLLSTLLRQAKGLFFCLWEINEHRDEIVVESCEFINAGRQTRVSILPQQHVANYMTFKDQLQLPTPQRHTHLQGLLKKTYQTAAVAPQKHENIQVQILCQWCLLHLLAS